MTPVKLLLTAVSRSNVVILLTKIDQIAELATKNCASLKKKKKKI